MVKAVIRCDEWLDYWFLLFRWLSSFLCRNFDDETLETRELIWNEQAFEKQARKSRQQISTSISAPIHASTPTFNLPGRLSRESREAAQICRGHFGADKQRVPCVRSYNKWTHCPRLRWRAGWLGELAHKRRHTQASRQSLITSEFSLNRKHIHLYDPFFSLPLYQNENISFRIAEGKPSGKSGSWWIMSTFTRYFF